MNELTKGVIVLTVIIIAAGAFYGYDIIDRGTLKEGDFAEIYYIGYFDNETVFNSSFNEVVTYDTSFDEDQYNLTALKIYLKDDIPTEYPEDWVYGDLGYIENLRVHEIQELFDALKDMQKGEEKIIEIPAENAFGIAIENGTNFYTSTLLGFNTTFEILNIYGVSIDVMWIPELGDIFTMPDYWFDSDVPTPPHWFWENATEVVSLNDTHATLRTTPNLFDNLTWFPWWENQSVASFDDEFIHITTNPTENNFTYEFFGTVLFGTIVDITEDIIEIEFSYTNQTESYEFNRTESFSREYDVPLRLNNVQKSWVEDDLREKGFSFHELAGNNIVLRVKIDKVYKVS